MEKLHNLYSSSYIIRGDHIKEDELDRARIRKVRNAYNISAKKTEGKYPLGRCRGRWMYNTE
jgi:hypothetical protein